MELCTCSWHEEKAPGERPEVKVAWVRRGSRKPASCLVCPGRPFTPASGSTGCGPCRHVSVGVFPVSFLAELPLGFPRDPAGPGRLLLRRARASEGSIGLQCAPHSRRSQPFWRHCGHKVAVKMPDQDLYRREAKKAPSPTEMQLGSFKGCLLPYVHLAANLSQTPQALSPDKVPDLWSPPAGALSLSLLSAV